MCWVNGELTVKGKLDQDVWDALEEGGSLLSRCCVECSGTGSVYLWREDQVIGFIAVECLYCQGSGKVYVLDKEG